MLLTLLSLILACSSSYDSPEDCMGLSSGAARDECWSIQAVALFGQHREDPQTAEKIIEEQVTNTQIRDFIWLDITKHFAPQSYQYCERIQESAMKQRCTTLVSRPHLHRELLQGGSENAPPPANGGPGAPPQPNGMQGPGQGQGGMQGPGQGQGGMQGPGQGQGGQGPR